MLIEGAGLRSVLVSGMKDIFYYSGYKTAGAFLLMGGGEAKLFTRILCTEAPARPGASVRLYKKLEEVAAQLKGSVGTDYTMPAATLLRLRRLAKCRLSDATKLIKEPRSVKETDELEKMRKAIRLTRKVFAATDPWGRTERDVAAGMEMAFLQKGARRAFPIIVASGSNAFYIHHIPTATKVTGGPVIMDAGARVEGYCADMTRTLTKGQEQRRLLEEAKAMQAEILDFIEPGMKMAAVQKFWESLMRRKGYKVMHAFGHGIGLDVHERVETIKVGTVLAVEPGIYMHGAGGWRVEDIAAVKKSGAKIL